MEGQLAVNEGAALAFIAGISDHYTANAQPYVRFLRETGGSISPATVLSYIEVLEGSVDSASTFNIRIAALKDRIKKLMDYENRTDAERFRIEQFLKKLPKRKVQRQIDPGRVISGEDLRRLVTECTDRKLQPLLEFLAIQGTRISETLNIKWSQVKRRKGYYEVRVLGKGRERILKVDAALIKIIKQVYGGKVWLFEHSGRRYNRTSIGNRFKLQALRILGAEHTLHDLRHSWATRMIPEIGLDAASRYLGHSSSRVTIDFYTSRLASFEDITKARRFLNEKYLSD